MKSCLLSIALLSALLLITHAFPFDPLYKALLKPTPLTQRQKYYLVFEEPLEEPEPRPHHKTLEFKRKRSIIGDEEPFELSANAVKRKILARIGKRQLNPARVGK